MSASVGGKGKAIVLNLTSMIDICAILIIFLVMGTVIGQEDLQIPPDFKFPKSVNREILENAPQIIIFRNTINVKFLKQEINLDKLISGESSERLALSGAIKSYISAMPSKVKASGVLLNLLADSSVPYKTIFDVSKYFRENGFESILYVAEGK